MFHINQNVFCYYDDEIPCFAATIISEEKTVKDIHGNDTTCYDVHWNDGGNSTVFEKYIFATNKEWEIFWNIRSAEIDKENEEREYKEYLRLKAKYENLIKDSFY